MSNKYRWFRILISAALLIFPTITLANFVWPPALYYYGATVWWAIPAGLVAEYLILLPCLHLRPLRLLKVVVITNVVSALVGLVAAGPVVFWVQHGGVFALVDIFPISIWFYQGLIWIIAVLVFSLNIFIEYFVAIRWLGISRNKISLFGFIGANSVSFVILVAAGISIFLR